MLIDRRQSRFPRQDSLDILHRQALKRNGRFERGPARVARQGHRSGPDQPGADVGLMGMHVHAGGADLARVDGVGQGVFVHEAAPSNIHQARAALELGKGRFRDERLAGERGGDQYAVRHRQHVAELVVKVGLDHLFLRAGLAHDVIVHNVHAEGEIRLLGNRVTDVPQSHDAQRVSSRVVRDDGGVEMRVLKFARVT